MFEYYDQTGQLRRREADYDDNGIVNSIEHFENGKLVRRELDTTNQGTHRHVGLLRPRDRRSAPSVSATRRATGKIDQWWTYEGDQGHDRDGSQRRRPARSRTRPSRSAPAARSSPTRGPPPRRPPPRLAPAPAAPQAPTLSMPSLNNEPAPPITRAVAGRRCCRQAAARRSEAMSIAYVFEGPRRSRSWPSSLSGGRVRRRRRRRATSKVATRPRRHEGPEQVADRRPLDVRLEEQARARGQRDGRPGRAASERAPRLQDVRRGRRASQDARVPRDRHEPRRHQGRRPHLQPEGRGASTRRPTATTTAGSTSGSTSSTGASRRRTSTRNNDGKPDVWKFYVNGQLQRIRRDRNFDGKADIWEIYSRGPPRARRPRRLVRRSRRPLGSRRAAEVRGRERPTARRVTR